MPNDSGPAAPNNGMHPTADTQDVIKLRGGIAHRLSSTKRVRKDDVKKSSVFIVRLAIASGNTLRDFIHSRTGQFPWDKGDVGFDVSAGI